MSDREWITDRLPTEADADKDGDVTVQDRPGAEPSSCPYFHWSMVRPGMAWTHSGWWDAPAEADEQAPPKPALAVGQRWRRRDGEVVTIAKRDPMLSTVCPFEAKGFVYAPDGSAPGASDFDLVELIEPAAEPATTLRRFVSISRTDWTADESDGHTLDAIADDGTAWWKHSYQAQWTQHPPLPSIEDVPPHEPAEIPEPIRTGAAPFYLLVISDDSGGKADGNPIVYETQIPEGSSLQAVLQQRQRVGSRYGTTYVAQCRIIPELTEVLADD